MTLSVADILGQIEPGHAQLFMLLAVLGVASLIGWVLLGVFDARRVCGSWRWEHDRLNGALLPAFIITLTVWIGVQLAFAITRPTPTPNIQGSGQTSAPGTMPSTLPTSVPATPVANPISGQTLVALSALAGLAALFAGLLVLAGCWPDGLDRLGMSLSALPRGLPTGVLASFLILVPLFWAGVFTDWLWQVLDIKHPSAHPLLTMLDESDSISLRVLIAVTAVIVAPLAEEFIFRGLLQSLLAGTMYWGAGYLTRSTTQKSSSDRAAVWSDALDTQPIIVTDSSDEPTGIATDDTPPTETPVDEVSTDQTLDYHDPRQPPTSSGLALIAPPAAPAWPRWCAIIITSLLFASIHDFWMFPPIFLLSLCLGYLYERTGSLWSSITLHALFNGTQTAVFLMSQS